MGLSFGEVKRHRFLGLQGLWEFFIPPDILVRGQVSCRPSREPVEEIWNVHMGARQMEEGREGETERGERGGRKKREKKSAQISHRFGNEGYVRSYIMGVKLTVRPSWSARSRQNTERVAHCLCTLPRQQPRPDSPSRRRRCVSGKCKWTQPELRIPSPATVPLS